MKQRIIKHADRSVFLKQLLRVRPWERFHSRQLPIIYALDILDRNKTENRRKLT
jgi:hypothetical protein